VKIYAFTVYVIPGRADAGPEPLVLATLHDVIGDK
jgi:hypothetical protein